MGLSHMVTILGAVVALTTANINITSPPITNWGNWGNFELCPFGRMAQGFQLKTEPNQYLGDDTALNAIKLFCGDPYRPDTAVITSTEGDFGAWGNVYTCYPGVLTAFQLRVESDRGSGDDTATNNARFWCSSKPNDYIEGDGMSWGDWSETQRCFGMQGICAIQTQLEPYLADNGDDTMLNNVRFECCDYKEKDLQADIDRVKNMENYPPAVLNPKFAPLLRKAVEMGLTNETSAQNGKVNPFNLLALAKVAGVAVTADEKVNTSEQDENVDTLIKATAAALQKAQKSATSGKDANLRILVNAVAEAVKNAENAPAKDVNVYVQ